MSWHSFAIGFNLLVFNLDCHRIFFAIFGLGPSGLGSLSGDVTTFLVSKGGSSCLTTLAASSDQIEPYPVVAAKLGGKETAPAGGRLRPYYNQVQVIFGAERQGIGTPL
jgi:hypothetical protein